MLKDLLLRYIPEEKPDEYKGRKLSKPPSIELEILAKTHPHLFYPSDSNVCTNVTMNFAGALILQEMNDFMFVSTGNAYTTHAMPLAETVQDITLYTTTDGKVWNDWFSVAEDVLVKNTCGGQVGIVTNGSLAGVIMRTVRRTDQWEHGGNIIRVLNDDIFDCTKYAAYPYPPEIRNHYLSSSQKDIIYEKLKEKYERLALHSVGVNTTHFTRWQLNKASRILSNKGILLTDMLQYQCAQMGIPFDKSQMHILSPKDYDPEKAEENIEEALHKIQETI